ncbi:hypothetical protein [Melghirimyces algeriensis]|uniref:Uncharacterized protein n=1 Tax=Melghirimyces algeriensis TaxID=910412 RepID=A0A521E0N5_9BACL|nr:hypothetical protein [Melghirimyces algeriensis]SMO77527.1 hypothetical protein SAMN06264849_10795 [Melghirimyces algeriensis]
MNSHPNRKRPDQPEHRLKPSSSSSIKPEWIHKAKASLAQSLFAESIMFSISKQISSLPGITHLHRLQSIHEVNRETGTHRLTAKGCLERISSGDWHESNLNHLVQSMYEARRHDRIQRGQLMELKRSVPVDARTAVENWIHWLDYSENTLQKAMVSTQELIGKQYWNRFIPR